MAASNEKRVVVRALAPDDIEAVQSLQRRCFPGMEPWSSEQLRAQVERFPEGQICVEYDGKLVATSSALLVDGEDYARPHTFREACDGGFIRNHDPAGDTIYGIDIAVDPSHRGMRLARRLYEARKELTRTMNLRAILIAGRIPEYHHHAAQMTADEYTRKVMRKEFKDLVLTAQLANGFAVRDVIVGYLPSDRESCGHAVLMEWLNPAHAPATGTYPRIARVAAVQYQMRTVPNFEAFAQQCEFFVDAASEYRADFVVFPELLTNQLQALITAERPALTARRLDEFTERYVDAFTRMAIKHNVNIIGGSHLTMEGEALYNIAYLFRRDGSVARQRKLHITPSELRWWGVTPGNELEVFDTDRGKVAILICYDVEFPELSRIAAAQGARILFVPFNTDIRSGYLRVRSCAHARCIENHVYAVLSGPVGNLPFVAGADIHYGQSCVLTPCDIPFARDGIAEEGTPNVETMVVCELDLDVLRRTRRSGAVSTWHDRRTDMYRVVYRHGGETQEI
ncbi:MAG: GNAT family N-acetyltransferase [Deltaproteobacteria bacterium]|nr:GNAT family N-acetyltransferase [Nannocystaceae bacterium]